MFEQSFFRKEKANVMNICSLLLTFEKLSQVSENAVCEL